jgi:hypothetical protein
MLENLIDKQIIEVMSEQIELLKQINTVNDSIINSQKEVIDAQKKVIDFLKKQLNITENADN